MSHRVATLPFAQGTFEQQIYPAAIYDHVMEVKCHTVGAFNCHTAPAFKRQKGLERTNSFEIILSEIQCDSLSHSQHVTFPHCKQSFTTVFLSARKKHMLSGV